LYIGYVGLPIPVAAFLRRGSAHAGLLGLRVQIPPRAWISVSSEWCMLSGRVLYGGQIVVPSMVCLSVWSWNLNDEEP